MAGRVLLTPDAPTATLNRRQSAIGSLVFAVPGATAGTTSVSAFWELTDGTTGVVDAASGSVTSPQFGRRSIVELTRQQVVIGLRHVHHVRRVLILVNGFEGQATARLVTELHDDATIEFAHSKAKGPVAVALAVYQVDGELVIRREDFGFDSVDAAGKAYGFTVNWLPPVERHG